MMFFVLLTASFRFLALFVAGASLSCFLFHGSGIGETAGTLGFALFVWLLGAGIDALLKIPFTLKFLNTRKKRIIATIICFVLGFVFPFS